MGFMLMRVTHKKQGYHKAKEIAKNAKVEEVQGYHIGCNEFLHRVIMKDCSKQAGRTINRETVIFDCTGMGWHRKCSTSGQSELY